MTKRVVIIASGRTEQEALPHLLRHLAAEDIAIDLPVLVPPGHHDLRCEQIVKLVRSAWFGRYPQPDKFVVLKDADAKDPREVAEKLEDELSRSRIQDIGAPVLVAVAKWHLEAWFFADPPGLREYLGGSIGTFDNEDADAIANPKLRLKSLLHEPYTSAISREIAERLSSSTLGVRSRSFRDFEAAVRNGHGAP